MSVALHPAPGGPAAWLRQHLSLLLNASAMMGSTVVTAGLGFVYWWAAARGWPAEAVGLASAAIAAMGFLALAGDLGLGTLLIGQLPQHPGRGPGLVSAAFIVAMGGSALLGGLYLSVASLLWPAGLPLAGGWVESMLFLVGVALTGWAIVLDQTLLGVLRGSWHLGRNISFAAVKLAALLLALGLGWNSARDILLTWVVGLVVSLVFLAWMARRGGLALWHRPDFALLRGLTGSILSHHALNVLSQAPGLLMPVLVTGLLSARVNAAFYAAWLLIGVAYLIPAALSTALFAVAARQPADLPRRLRFSLGLSMGAAVLTILLTLGLGTWALTLFQPAYAEQASAALQLLALAMPAVVIKYHYLAIKRIREQMAGALPLLAIGGLAELGAAAVGAQHQGLTGVAAGWLLASTAQALVMLPLVWRAARAAR